MSSRVSRPSGVKRKVTTASTPPRRCFRWDPRVCGCAHCRPGLLNLPTLVFHMLCGTPLPSQKEEMEERKGVPCNMWRMGIGKLRSPNPQQIQLHTRGPRWGFRSGGADAGQPPTLIITISHPSAVRAWRAARAACTWPPRWVAKRTRQTYPAVKSRVECILGLLLRFFFGGGGLGKSSMSDIPVVGPTFPPISLS